MSYIKKIKDVDLSKYDHGHAEYVQSYEMVDQYAFNVLTSVISTNSQTKSACARYIYDREFRTDVEFRTHEVQDVINFTNKMKHTKGKLAGKPLHLMMWMIFILGNMFGWYCAEGERQYERRFIKTLILVARGNAKSMIASIIASYGLLTSPNGSPSVYSVARTAKQAGIVFNDAKKMIRGADWDISNYFESKAYEIISPFNDGEFRALAAEAQSMDGLRVSVGKYAPCLI